MISLALDERVLTAVDAARAEDNQDRSTFIRLAIIDYLRARGYPLSKGLGYAPDRARRIRKSKRAPKLPPESCPMLQPASSDPMKGDEDVDEIHKGLLESAVESSSIDEPGGTRRKSGGQPRRARAAS